MNFGLVLRRMRNDFYTTVQTLIFDIEQVEETYRRLGDPLVGVARGIVLKLKKVIEAPGSLPDVMDLSAVDVEEERQRGEGADAEAGAEAEGKRKAEAEKGDRRPGNLKDTRRDRSRRKRQQDKGDNQDNSAEDIELPMFQIRPRPGPAVDSE
jgi:hypothetical protein